MSDKPDISPVPLRILALEIQNIKRISYIEIAPKSKLVGLYGKNGSGKTSTLDSIMWALGGARNIQLEPIRKGQEQARVRLAIGDKTIEFVITRSFKQGKKPELTIESGDGALQPRPQEFVNGLLGAISLDPLEFIRMDAKEQLNVLKQLVQLEVDVDLLDRQNDADFKRRTDVNRDVERLKGQVQLYAGGVNTMDVTPIDTDALVAEMSKASERNAEIYREQQRRDQDAQSLRTQQIALTTLDAEIERLMEKRKQLTLEIGSRIHDMEEANTPLAPMIDVSDLGEKIKRAQSENTMRQLQRTARDRYETAKKELETEVAKSRALTGQMEIRTAQKMAALANAKYPVEGLSIGNDMVLLDGVPFEQGSMAHKIRASIRIKVALCPRLPVVLIRELGALLDDDNMAVVEEEAERIGAQVWIERQKPSQGERGDVIVFDEGEIIEVDGQPTVQK